MTSDPSGRPAGAAYPPEPWHLRGHCLVALWLVPADLAPAPPAPGSRAMRLLGRRLVVTAFFSYEPPSPLTYGEVMEVVPVLDRGRPRLGVTRIWVDSPASLAGGRALWGIPKELAGFDLSPGAYAAPGIAAATWRPPARPPRRPRWSPWLPVRFSLAQERNRERCVTPVRGSTRMMPARADWRIDADGPLGHLAGRRPLLSLRAPAFRLRFGS